MKLMTQCLCSDDVSEALDFAKKTCLSTPNRTGYRSREAKIKDIVKGKIGEMLLVRKLGEVSLVKGTGLVIGSNIIVDMRDLGSSWDDSDIKIGQYKISIKTVDFRGKLYLRLLGDDDFENDITHHVLVRINKLNGKNLKDAVEDLVTLERIQDMEGHFEAGVLDQDEYNSISELNGIGYAGTRIGSLVYALRETKPISTVRGDSRFLQKDNYFISSDQFGCDFEFLSTELASLRRPAPVVADQSEDHKFSNEANLKSYPDDMSEYRKLPIRKASNGLYGGRLPELDDLVGASVLDVGFHPSCQEGGLAIDYEKDGEHKRIVMGYTELGTWVEWAGALK